MDHIALVRSLNLPVGQYIVIGSSSLAVRNIRNSPDVDILVIPELFKKLLEKGFTIDDEFKQKWGRERLVQKPFEIYYDMHLEREKTIIPASEMIARAEYIGGVAFMTLSDLLLWKKDNSRPKDLADIVLIEDYLSKNI